MVKKEVGAIIVALLFVATLGAGVASAKGVVVGGGYNGTSVDTSRYSYDDFFTTDLWNGSFWDSVAEEEVEAVKKARAARAVNESAEEPDSFWRSEDKTRWPAGYWAIDPHYKNAFPSYGIPGYWDVNWIIPWP